MTERETIMIERETTIENKIPIKKGNDTTFQNNAPIEKANEIAFQNNAPIEKANETTFQNNAPIEKANETTFQNNAPIEKANETTLDQLETGCSGFIKTVGGKGALRRRLLDMGLTPGTQVMVRKVAPMGDPIELHLRSYELTIRREDAGRIQVEVVQ